MSTRYCTVRYGTVLAGNRQSPERHHGQPPKVHEFEYFDCKIHYVEKCSTNRQWRFMARLVHSLNCCLFAWEFPTTTTYPRDEERMDLLAKLEVAARNMVKSTAQHCKCSLLQVVFWCLRPSVQQYV